MYLHRLQLHDNTPLYVVNAKPEWSLHFEAIVQTFKGVIPSVTWGQWMVWFISHKRRPVLTCYTVHCRSYEARKKRSGNYMFQIPNLIESVITALLMDGSNPWSPLRARAGVLWVLEITCPTGVRRWCAQIQVTADWPGTGWRRLIDPENRDACGRIVIEPGTDV